MPADLAETRPTLRPKRAPTVCRRAQHARSLRPVINSCSTCYFYGCTKEVLGAVVVSDAWSCGSGGGQVVEGSRVGERSALLDA